ncbi:MAG: transposase, partial [Pseudomonadota bacterium]
AGKPWDESVQNHSNRAQIAAIKPQQRRSARPAELRRSDQTVLAGVQLAKKDRDARWTLKRGRRKRRPDGSMMEAIATPVFGYQSYSNVDQGHGLIQKWSVTDASQHDGRELPDLVDRSDTASAVWADTVYRSRKNERHFAKAGLVSKIQFRRTTGKSLRPEHHRANAARSRVRSHVEHPFAEQKSRMDLFIRAIGIARATVKIGMPNIALYKKRLVFLKRRVSVA